DLKPTISTFRSLSKVSPFVVNFHFAAYLNPQTRRAIPLPTALRRDLAEWPQFFRAKRDDFPFLEGRGVPAMLSPVTDRKQTRLAGSRSEAQPPGAKMAVRELRLPRPPIPVKAYSTYSGVFAHATSAGSSGRFRVLAATRNRR